MVNNNHEASKQPIYIVAGSTMLAGLFIAASIIVSNNYVNSTDPEAMVTDNHEEQNVARLERINPITEEDHVRGSRNAQITIVEYSDFECQFCQSFHDTLNNIYEKYNDDEVAWVFRHFPIEQSHTKATQAARASECAAHLGEDGAFWQFTDSYFEKTPSNNQVDLDTLLPEIIAELDIDISNFNSCLHSGDFDEKIQNNLANAAETGGRGTPWSILIGPEGEKYPINGAQPQASIEALIDSILSN